MSLQILHIMKVSSYSSRYWHITRIFVLFSLEIDANSRIQDSRGLKSLSSPVAIYSSFRLLKGKLIRAVWANSKVMTSHFAQEIKSLGSRNVNHLLSIFIVSDAKNLVSFRELTKWRKENLPGGASKPAWIWVSIGAKWGEAGTDPVVIRLGHDDDVTNITFCTHLMHQLHRKDSRTLLSAPESDIG